MCNIKIFVSHRIDMNSELIDNPLYVPMRCGAVYDHENRLNIPGDDTGDHISERRMSFCEFTVQYWAWKNVVADYYGLCHYRRYLAFTEKRYPTNEHNMICLNAMLPEDKRRYGLLDNTQMEKVIQQYDIITSEPAPVVNIPTPCGKVRTVKEMWEAYAGEFFPKESIDLLFSLIQELAPEYVSSAKEYFSGAHHRGYNCYVLRKDLFVRLCQFQFPIMLALTNQLDAAKYAQTMPRTPAYIGEMLYGIFLYHLTTYESWRVRELQLLFFRSADRPRSIASRLRHHAVHRLDRLIRIIVAPIMPIGSPRRERLKKLYFRITSRN